MNRILNRNNTGPSEESFPAISEALIKRLDNNYPERSPDPNDSERELWMKAGERRLVRRLLAEYEKQTSNVLLS